MCTLGSTCSLLIKHLVISQCKISWSAQVCLLSSTKPGQYQVMSGFSSQTCPGSRNAFHSSFLKTETSQTNSSLSLQDRVSSCCSAFTLQTPVSTGLPAGNAPPPPARPAQQPQTANSHWNCISAPLRKGNRITTENICQETCRMLSWAGNIFLKCSWIHSFVFNNVLGVEVTGTQSNCICHSASIYSASQNTPSYGNLAGLHRQ